MSRLPAHPASRCSGFFQPLISWLTVVGSLSGAACEEDKTPTAASVAAPVRAVSADAINATPQGTIALPINQSGSTASPTPLFALTQTGTGPNGQFKIANPANSLMALLGQTNGSGIAVRGVATSATGRAGSFEITNSSNIQDVLFAKANGNGTALHAVANGFGMAGKFDGVRNSGSNTLYASAIGTGNAISAVNTGTGHAGMFVKTLGGGQNSTLFVQSASFNAALESHAVGGHAGRFENNGGVDVLFVKANGSGPVADFESDKSSVGTAIFIGSRGSGTALHIDAAGHGLIIDTPAGKTGLSVTGGTKNAVVGTTAGARALYTEESSEVWFTDYGFGKTRHGRVRILIDPTFAQTINSDEPYHVFLEEYGDVQLYVAERTPLGFVVQSHGGEDVEFSYRIVARRRGYEATRLEPAPWADGGPGLEAHN